MYAIRTAIASKTAVIITKVRLLTLLWRENSWLSWTTRTSAQISSTTVKVENTSPVSTKAARLAWFCSLLMAASIFEQTLLTITGSRKITPKNEKTTLQLIKTCTVLLSYSISCSSSHTAVPSESSSILMSSGLLNLE